MPLQTGYPEWWYEIIVEKPEIISRYRNRERGGEGERGLED